MIIDHIREMKKILQNKGLKSYALIGTAKNRGSNKNFRLNN